MKQLFLHIGLHKTGTTALQQWCSANASLLAEKGLLYPSVGQPEGKPYHRQFFSQAESGPWELLYSEIEQSGIDTILLSDEAWSAPWVAEGALQMLKHRLARYDVTVLCVLRNPVDYFVSRYRHQIRMGSDSAHWSFSEFVEARVGETNEFLSQLELWSNVFGRQNVDVLIYDEAKKGGALGRHFLAKCGLEISEVELPKSNVHWDERRLKMLRLAKKLECVPSGRESESLWRQAVAKRIRSAGYGRATLLRSMVGAAVTVFDHSPLISEDGLRTLQALCSRWPLELMQAGWLDAGQVRALAKV
jgi:hypothetical protein